MASRWRRCLDIAHSKHLNSVLHFLNEQQNYLTVEVNFASAKPFKMQSILDTDEVNAKAKQNCMLASN